MILLASTTDLIQVVTGGTQNVEVHASYVDASGQMFNPGRTNTPTINSATTTTIVGSPSANYQRSVKTIVITNTDASASDAITVQHTDGTNVVNLFKVTLLAGYTIHYDEGDGWYLVDASGGVVVTPLSGRLLKSTVLTVSGNFTTSPATNTIHIRGVGGGGGGGGCSSVASAAAAAGGGGSGGYLEKTIAVTPNTIYAFTCGAAGTNASGAAGGNGGASTFVVGATTYTANGGSGGALGTAATTLTAYAGGAGAAVSTNGDLNSGGSPGGPGVILIVATPIGASGDGGSSQFGGGGDGLTVAGAGNAATGFGSGGGGSMTGASAARAGGAATAGCWVVDEYS